MDFPAQRIIEREEIAGWDRVVDVLIVGSGCAGLSAAIESAQAGADTLVIERASGVGGTSAMSGAVIYLGGGTAIQRACGFEDTVEDMYAYLSASCGIRPDPAKLRLYCGESIRHYEWLCSLGIPFKSSYWPHNFEPWTDDCLYYSGSELTQPYRDMARPAPRGHTVQSPGSCTGGRVLIEKLHAAALQAGARVATDTRAIALVRDRSGCICGLSTKMAGRTEYLGARRGIVIATGGFISNASMVGTYAPQLAGMMPLGGPGDDGSGMEMGMAAGGTVINMHAAAYAWPVLLPVKLIEGILVNAHGQRFVNEDVNHKRIGEMAVLGQGGRIYLLVDSHCYEKPERGDIAIVASGDTIAEVEMELAFPKGSLQHTVDLYNRFAALGEDPQFGKQSPYLRPLDAPPYGVFDCSLGRGAPYLAFTLGGLRTAPSGEVLRPDGGAVTGLYAAGRATSCLSAQSCGSSGVQIGEGTFFGRRAGQAAAGQANRTN